MYPCRAALMYIIASVTIVTCIDGDVCEFFRNASGQITRESPSIILHSNLSLLE